jgi:hypothetical protein
MLLNNNFEENSWNKTFCGKTYNEISSPKHWVTFWKEGGEISWDLSNKEGYRRPECKVIERVEPYLDPIRIHSGNKAWQLFTFYAIHDAGIYQQVDVEEGSTYRFSAYTHAWSSQNDDPHNSTDDKYNFTQAVGIDPTGNTDPYASSVLWKEDHIYDTFGKISVEAEAKSNKITVFLRSKTKWRFKHNDVYWDTTNLEKVSDAPSEPTKPSTDETLSLDEVIKLLEDSWPKKDTVEINFKQYSQRDSRWRNDRLGESKYTIGSAGCAMTVATMLATQVEDINPKEMNTWLSNHNGYTHDGRLWWKKVSERVKKLSFEKYVKWTTTPADMDMIYSELEDHPVILRVDFVPNTSKLDSHFVVAYGKTDNDLLIVDPIDGSKTKLLERYAEEDWDLARAIYALVVYEVSEQSFYPSQNILGLHLQNIPDDSEQEVKDYISKSDIVKVFNANDALIAKSINPDIKVVYRHWVDNKTQERWLNNIDQGIDEFFAAMHKELTEYNQYIDYVESINEVCHSSVDRIRKAVKFDVKFADRLSKYNLKPVLLTIPVGNPHNEDWYRELIPAVDKVVEYDGAVGYHAYWWYDKEENGLTSWWPYHAGRWTEMDKVFSNYNLEPSYFLGEVGAVVSHDKGKSFDSDKGWKVHLSWKEYKAQLQEFEQLVNTWNTYHKNRCIGTSIFTTGQNVNWESYQIRANEIKDL